MKRFVYFNNLNTGPVKIFECLASDIELADEAFGRALRRGASERYFSVTVLDAGAREHRGPATFGFTCASHPVPVERPPYRRNKAARAKVPEELPPWCRADLSVEQAVLMMPLRIRTLIERDGILCHWCQRPCDPRLPPNSELYPTREHLMRLADGGSNMLENLAVACRHCNSNRHNPGWQPPTILINNTYMG